MGVWVAAAEKSLRSPMGYDSTVILLEGTVGQAPPEAQQAPDASPPAVVDDADKGNEGERAFDQQGLRSSSVGEEQVTTREGRDFARLRGGLRAVKAAREKHGKGVGAKRAELGERAGERDSREGHPAYRMVVQGGVCYLVRHPLH